MQRHYGLVAGHHVSAIQQRRFNQLQCGVFTADELYHDIQIVAPCQGEYVSGERGTTQIHLGLCGTAGYGHHLQLPTRAARDAFGIVAQHLQHALGHGAEAT